MISSIEDTINLLRYGIDAYDQERFQLERAGEIRPMDDRELYLGSEILWSGGRPWWLFWSCLAHISGLVIVEDTATQMIVMGTAINRSAFKACHADARKCGLRKSERLPATVAAIRALKPTNPVPSAISAERVRLPKLQHYVAERFPEFRLENDPRFPDTEVIFRPGQKGRRIGGIIWRREAYETEIGRKFLRIG